MLRILIVFVLLAACVTNVRGQVTFSGQVEYDEGAIKKPVSFASVVLSTCDSVTVVSTLTDLAGSFVFKNIRVGTYKISISCLGYETIEEDIRITFPSVGSVISRNYSMAVKSHSLEAVTVTASTAMRKIDKTTFVITKEDLEHSAHGIDLLGKIPQLSFNESTQKVRSSLGGDVKILINGASASEQELLSLDASQIKNIEFYDFPPAQYAGYSNVVNIITRHINDGLYGGINLQHAFTTGFANDGLFLRYNWGHNQIALNTSTGYRNYTDVDHSSNYLFNLNNTSYVRREEQERKFGYDDNYVNLSYSKNIPEKYQLQISFSPNFQHRHIDGDLDITQSIGETDYGRDGSLRERSSQFSPSLDIYTSIKLPKRQELIVNVLGTYHNADLQYARHETDKTGGEIKLQDIMSQSNGKSSLIAQAQYSKQSALGTIAFGNNFSYGKLTSLIDNSFASADYFTNVTTNHIYTELTGSKHQFMYRLSLGGYLYENVNNERSYTSWAFKPVLLLGYRMTDHLSVRSLYGRTTSDPTLAQLSSNKVLISENIVREGNPALKNSVTDIVSVLLNLNYSWVSLEMALGYMNQSRPVNSYFTQNDDVISLRYENAKLSKSMGWQYSILIDPLKKKLFTLKLSGDITRNQIDSRSAGYYSYLSYPFFYEGTFNYNGFSLSYQGNVRGWSLSGPYLDSDEVNSTLRLRYIHKNWTFSATCMWLLRDAKYESRTILGSIVDYSYVNNIKDNMNMFTLGLSYRFNIGKKYDETQRLLNNSDKDAGLFR